MVPLVAGARAEGRRPVPKVSAKRDIGEVQIGRAIWAKLRHFWGRIEHSTPLLLSRILPSNLKLIGVRFPIFGAIDATFACLKYLDETRDAARASEMWCSCCCDSAKRGRCLLYFSRPGSGGLMSSSYNVPRPSFLIVVQFRRYSLRYFHCFILEFKFSIFSGVLKCS